MPLESSGRRSPTSPERDGRGALKKIRGPLKKIFDRDEDVPYPILTSYKTWNGTENGHGVHFWAPGRPQFILIFRKFWSTI